ncbi:MAG TPA: extracellular solute-binding protein [Spirochaetia bacterium]|nr:extracellular solute-binding protein [Spirochaetia bacterium]
MKSIMIRGFFLLLFVLLGAGLCFASGQTAAKKETVNLTYWSVCNFPEYDPYWEEVAKKVNAEHPEVDLTLTLTCVPYQGYEAKYKSAFEAGKGPDVFFDMTHVTAGELEVSDKMPDDIAKKLDTIMAGPGAVIGIYDGVRYGVPVEGGYFMMMFINNTLYQGAGLDPAKPALTYTEMLAHAKKLTKTDASGKITTSGYAIRYKGHPFGIADKALPFVDAWGTKILDWSQKKASGYVNSPEAVAAIDFYGGLVTREKVSSVDLGVPMEIFAQGVGGIMFRECFAVAWMNKNNPDLKFSVHPLPKQKVVSGYAGNFPWSIQVNKDAPEVNKKWAWEIMRTYVNSKEMRKEHAIKADIIPPFKDLLNEPEFVKHPAYKAFMTMAEGRPATNYHIPPAQEILQAFGQAVLDVMFGKDQAKPALDKAAVAMDAVLARYK